MYCIDANKNKQLKYKNDPPLLKPLMKNLFWEVICKVLLKASEPYGEDQGWRPLTANPQAPIGLIIIISIPTFYCLTACVSPTWV